MSRGINKVILVGNLGKDPETKYMPSGGAVTNITVATAEGWKDKTTGEMQERTEWHRVVFFNRLAEIAAEYLTKGKQVYIEGSLRTRKWEKDGHTNYTTEIVANEMQMLGGAGGGGGRGGDSDGGGRPANRGSGGGGSSNRPAPSSMPEPQMDPDDDIPF